MVAECKILLGVQNLKQRCRRVSPKILEKLVYLV